MGKRKSKEEEPQLSEAFSSLFTADNPFRRKEEEKPDESKKRKALKNTENCPDSILIDELSDKKSKKKKRVDEDEEEGVVIGSPGKKRKRYEIAVDFEEISQDGVEVGRKRKRKAEVKDKEIVVRREEFDDESKLVRTVFIGNLPLKTKKKMLLKEFEGFGEIESLRIRSVPIIDSKAPRKTLVMKGQVNDAIDRVHAYIVFKDEKSVQSALSHNMTVIGGNHIRVDKACPPRKKSKGEAPVYSVKKTVFVGNLPYDVKDEEIYQLFCGDNQVESNVEAVRVIRDSHTSQGKGIAYVLFKTREAANSVIKKELILCDRILRLSHAKPEAATSNNLTPSKRKMEGGPKQSDYNKKPHNSPGGTDYQPKVKNSSLSYQGLRSSKSGVLKKAPRETTHLRSVAKGRTEPAKPEAKSRSAKRPAVAARKAKALKRKFEGASEQSHKTKKPKQ